MRDPTLEQRNAYLAGLRTAYDAAQHAAEGLADVEPIVSGLVDWCRGVVFKPVWMGVRHEPGSLSDLLTLPPSQSPLQVLECVSDATRRESLGEAFSGLMEGREGNQSNVAAWQNGASPGDLDDVLRRNLGHLDAILRQFELWHELERKVRRRPEIAEALARFRMEAAGGANKPRYDG